MRLIDADALYRKVKAECNPYGKPSIGWEDGKRMMEWIEHAPTVAKDIKVPDKWVSVKDRLPEKSGEYICWFGANKLAMGPAIETYVDEWKAFGDLITLAKYPNITHWMPLPEPPKEG